MFYATKVDNQESSRVVLETLAEFEDREARRTHAQGTVLTDPIADRGRFMLSHAVMVAHGSVTIPLAMAALLAKGAGDSLEAHKYAVHDFRIFTASFRPARTAAGHEQQDVLVTPQFAEDPDAPAAAPSTNPPAPATVAPAAATAPPIDSATDAMSTDDAGAPPTEGTAPRLHAVTEATDYQHRGPALAPYSPVLVSMWFQKVRLHDVAAHTASSSCATICNVSAAGPPLRESHGDARGRCHSDAPAARRHAPTVRHTSLASSQAPARHQSLHLPTTPTGGRRTGVAA
jgi:hypothetical protein